MRLAVAAFGGFCRQALIRIISSAPGSLLAGGAVAHMLPMAISASFCAIA